jgi:hypothetical protein
LRSGTGLHARHNFSLVIPARAKIQTAHPPSGSYQGPVDSRLRGNDEEFDAGSWAGEKTTCNVTEALP